MIFQEVVFAEEAGTVLFATKDTFLERNNTQQALQRGSILMVGDRIITAKDGSVQFKYSNGTLIALQPNSSYKIISYTPNNKELQSTASLDKGGLESTTQNQKKAKLETPVFALAISGTHYRISIFCSQGNICKKAGLEVMEGTVIVNDLYALGPGQTHNSAVYNGVTKQINYRQIHWPKHGWVNFNSGYSDTDDIDLILVTDFANTEEVEVVMLDSATTVAAIEANAIVAESIGLASTSGLIPITVTCM